MPSWIFINFPGSAGNKKHAGAGDFGNSGSVSGAWTCPRTTVGMLTGKADLGPLGCHPQAHRDGRDIFNRSEIERSEIENLNPAQLTVKRR